jgi:hypothetical protein
MNAETIDLGHEHTIRLAVWDPDMELNPSARKYQSELPLTSSGIVQHTRDGVPCEGVITFDSPIAREVFSGPFWTVESWDPLTLSPSLLCACGDHGFIREGKWVAALWPHERCTRFHRAPGGIVHTGPAGQSGWGLLVRPSGPQPP